ncbi:MAG: hypothetical protein ACFCUJ_13095 [Thiotrichales bacterium]
MRNSPSLIALALSLAVLPVAAIGDIVVIDGQPAVVQHRDLPSRGMRQQEVAARFGTPLRQRAAVGNPPISSWDYDRFVVYFEYDRVVHAVVRRR